MSAITLREYIDLKIKAIEDSIAVAYQAMERRLDGMNEFRNTLKDQSSTFVLKVEFGEFKKRVEDDIRFLREGKAELQGKASQTSVIITLIISLSGLVLGIINTLK